MCYARSPLAWLKVTTTQELIDVVFHHLSQARLGKGAATSEGDGATVGVQCGTGKYRKHAFWHSLWSQIRS